MTPKPSQRDEGLAAEIVWDRWSSGKVAKALSEARAEGVKEGLEMASKITELAFRHICRGTDCCSEFQQKEIAQAIRKENERG